MQPVVGRVVHYTNLGDADGKYPPQVQAAIITAVYRRNPTNTGETWLRINSGFPDIIHDLPQDLVVDLKVFYNSGFFDCHKMPFAERMTRGHWHWPNFLG